MKKLFSFFTLITLIAFSSCSKENIIVSEKNNNVLVSEQNFTVQGQPYDLKVQTTRSSTLASAASSGDANFSMDDIKFWVGSGSNKAVLVIEWHDGKTPDALVWGYKWDGNATGFDMIKAIVNADPRLIFLTHLTNYGNTIAGLGYNINKNWQTHYVLYDYKNFDPDNYLTSYFDNPPQYPNYAEPTYPTKGIIETNAYNYDYWFHPDSTSHWRAGWYGGYWSYWVKDSREEDWTYSNWGASSRELVDGSWDGWSFLDDMNIWTGKPLGDKFVAALPN